MNSNGSPYGKGFVIRMCVLLGILILVGAGYYYDRTVLIPGADEKVDEVTKLVYAKTDDGQGIPKSQIHEAIGNWATKTNSYTHTQAIPAYVKADEAKLANFKPQEYEVEQFSFKRVLPFLKGRQMEVVYLNEATIFAKIGDEPISKQELDTGFESAIKFDSDNENHRPAAMGGGGGGAPRGGGGGNNAGRPGESDSDEAKDGDEEKSEEKEGDHDHEEGEDHKDHDEDKD